MKFKSVSLGAALLAMVGFGAVPAAASTFEVFAAANSSSGGTGLNTIALVVGQTFTVQVDPGDLWNAGPLPRWSNADGLTHNLLAVSGDDSGEAPGTLIGQAFPLYTQDGFTAPYGALVGQIDSGAYFLIGTSYAGVAALSGILKLFYWDSNNFDNTGSILARIEITPVPAALPLFASGLGALGFMALRRRRRA